MDDIFDFLEKLRAMRDGGLPIEIEDVLSASTPRDFRWEVDSLTAHIADACRRRVNSMREDR